MQFGDFRDDLVPAEYNGEVIGLTSRRKSGGRAILVDIDNPVYAVTHDSLWHIELSFAGDALRTVLVRLGVMSATTIDTVIRCPWVHVPSSTPDHSHLYLDVRLNSYQELAIHALLAAAGMEGQRNLTFLVDSGCATLFLPGAKAKLGSTGSDDACDVGAVVYPTVVDSR